MNIVAIIANKDREHEEYYSVPDGCPDDKIMELVDALVNNFNNTLRPHELPIEVKDVYEAASDEDHNWYPLVKHKWDKANLVTQSSGGRMYDSMRCEKCGITGRRYGLSETITVDKKYAGGKYRNCKL